MSRTVTICFAAVALFLVLFPLSLAKPGLPLTLKSDEPAYYLMALSLVHDRDLVCEVKDIQRLGVEFPYTETQNLILGSPDGWKTVYFGKPFLVSLLAAPWAALFGADGFVAMNMALLLLSVWLGALWLRQWNPDATSLLFSAGFFLLSNAFAYVFWLHTETLCVASTTACLYLGLTPAGGSGGATRFGRWRALLSNDKVRLALSGAALVFGAYNKPYLALLGLPVVVGAWRRSGARGVGSWLAGAAATTLAVCGLSIALIGEPTPYLGLARQGVEVVAFDRMPLLPEPTPPRPPAAHGGAAPAPNPDEDPSTNNSFSWIFESFRLDENTLPNLGYFLVGRHTGLFPYAPFALLSLLLFFWRGPRDLERWLLLASLAGIALYSLTFIWFNWHGGGGFVGNRYFVNALPGFLFLAGRIAPSWLPVVGYALAGMFVGGIVFTPFGANVAAPTLQAHTRNGPFQLLPFEKTLAAQIPGYLGLRGGAGSFFYGRADLFYPVDDALWVVGGQRVDLELRTPAPLARPVFEVATFIAPNRVELALGGAQASVQFDSAVPPGNVTRIALDHPEPSSRRKVRGGTIDVYRLSVHADRQLLRDEHLLYRESKSGPPRTRQEIELPDWERSDVRILVGAAVTYLGEAAELDADLYSVDWLDARFPASWPANRVAAVPIRLRNASGTVWRANGATAVAVSYHWLRPDGSRETWEGLRSLLPRDVAPGEEVAVRFEVETPKTPGSYVLMLDLVREKIAWFSEKRAGQSPTRPVEIVPTEGR